MKLIIKYNAKIKLIIKIFFNCKIILTPIRHSEKVFVYESIDYIINNFNI